LSGKDGIISKVLQRYRSDENDFSLLLDSGKVTFDCVFIAIHGSPGEDGRIQGYLDMLNMPYTTCNSNCISI
jgi:D-alanine-D-alanine ligase